MPLIGYDTANGDFVVPGDAQWVACYRDGLFANERAARARFPHLSAAGRVLSITVRSGDADCDDIEPGNSGPSQAVPFLQRQRSKLQRPCEYADQSDMRTIATNLRAAGYQVGAAGPPRPFRLWVAHPNGIPHICGPSTCGFEIDCDATQFWWSSIQGPWHGFPGDLDVSLARDDFFGAPAPIPPPPTTGENMIAVGRNEDGRLELFVETQDGSVFHTWQTAANKGFRQDATGKVEWSPLGKPA